MRGRGLKEWTSPQTACLLMTMADAGETKLRTKLEALRRATEEVVRLRRETAEAEARREALLAELVMPESQLHAALLPKPPVVVLSAYGVCVAQLRRLGRVFDRRDAREATGLADRTLSRHFRRMLKEGIMRRRGFGRYEMVSATGQK